MSVQILNLDPQHGLLVEEIWKSLEVDQGLLLHSHSVSIDHHPSITEEPSVVCSELLLSRISSASICIYKGDDVGKIDVLFASRAWI